MRVQLELNVPSPIHHPKDNVGGKIAFGQGVKKNEAKNEKKTPDNAQEWKEKLPPAYWFYKIGEQLDLKTPYKDLSQKTFNKEAIQQVKKFIGKNNLTLYYKAVYRLYAAFQHCPNVLLNGSMKTIIFEDQQKAILKATIEHYMNKATITDTYKHQTLPFPISTKFTCNNTRDFELAELETNYAQAINLIMNESSELDSKLKQFSNSINQKLERYLADNCTIYQPLQ
ncbi:hypothetical protein G9A89_005850 [Geosiphon pyriformis]|nr:hypothetical protein G9A89_005850 [Geosiphon pyriformis]